MCSSSLMNSGINGIMAEKPAMTSSCENQSITRLTFQFGLTKSDMAATFFFFPEMNVKIRT